MEINHRELPVRLYRGTTYVVSMVVAPAAPNQPIIYDGEGFPIRWVPEQPVRQPIGFRIHDQI